MIKNGEIRVIRFDVPINGMNFKHHEVECPLLVPIMSDMISPWVPLDVMGKDCCGIAKPRIDKNGVFVTIKKFVNWPNGMNKLMPIGSGNINDKGEVKNFMLLCLYCEK